jgi:iron complex transport system ATP-binding protein
MVHTAQKILLSVKNLSVGYSAKGAKNCLFSNLNLSLEAGQLVCFMGANGVGKSSLIRTLAGLQKPIDSKSSINLEPKKISIVLTDRINTINMTVAELVTLGRYPYLDWNIKLNKDDLSIIENAIDATHIRHIADKKLYELSDGQLQMTMIARALAQDTPVILLDEPTAHLDLNNRVEIMNLLRKLSRTAGKAILVATHELDLALQTADLIWLAGTDKKLITGIPEDLVLNGSFDDTFQFKGFDLKTGKVFHESYQNKSVQLIGEGYEYLWTKNALERNGYSISDPAENIIHVRSNQNKITWDLAGSQFNSLQEVLQKL